MTKTEILNCIKEDLLYNSGDTVLEWNKENKKELLSIISETCKRIVDSEVQQLNDYIDSLE